MTLQTHWGCCAPPRGVRGDRRFSLRDPPLHRAVADAPPRGHLLRRRTAPRAVSSPCELSELPTDETVPHNRLAKFARPLILPSFTTSTPILARDAELAIRAQRDWRLSTNQAANPVYTASDEEAALFRMASQRRF